MWTPWSTAALLWFGPSFGLLLRALLRPHRHLGHRGKECADLMMHRKSAEPHSYPCHWTRALKLTEALPTVNASPLQKVCENIVCASTLHGDSSCATTLFLVVPLLRSPPQRSRRSQPSKTQSRRVETECKELYPLKADGKLAGGTKGLSTEADCYKWLQLLPRPWSWLQ